MGSFPFTVETASDETRLLRTLGEFRTLPVAIAAAKHALFASALWMQRDSERVGRALSKRLDQTGRG